MGEREKIYIQT
jgi:hypothetical protein